MVLCGFKQQIELLSRLLSFEVDMSFKRIRAKTMNEVLFATFLPDQCKGKYSTTAWCAVTDQFINSHYLTPSFYQ